MSTRPLGLDPSIGGSSGVGSVGQGGGPSDVDLGQVVGNMGAMNLLGTSRQMTVRANAIDVGIAIDQHRKSSVKQVIASLGEA